MTCTSPSQNHRDEGILPPASLWVEATAPSGSSDTVLADGNARSPLLPRLFLPRGSTVTALPDQRVF